MIMTKYHLNPQTDIPMRCGQPSDCPLGVEEDQHYSSREEAFVVYDEIKKTQESFSVISEVKPLPEGVKINKYSALLPAGEYWFGDAAYVFPDSEAFNSAWINESGDSSDDFVEPIAGAVIYDHVVLSFNLPHGDGVFCGDNNFDYPVDSGALTFVPLALFDKEGFRNEMRKSLGTLHTFTQETLVSLEDDLIVFGDISVSVN